MKVTIHEKELQQRYSEFLQLSRDELLTVAGVALHLAAASHIPFGEGTYEKWEADFQSRTSNAIHTAGMIAPLFQLSAAYQWHTAFDEKLVLNVGEDSTGVAFAVPVEGANEQGKAILADTFACIKAEQLRAAKELLAGE